MIPLKSWFLSLAALSCLTTIGAEAPTFSLQGLIEANQIEKRDAELELLPTGTEYKARLKLGDAIDWPGVSLLPQNNGVWNLSKCRVISLKIKNRSPLPRTFYWRIDNPGADGTNHCITERALLQPGEETILYASLARGDIDLIGGPLKNMNGQPECKLDLANITGMIFFVPKSDAPAEFEVGEFTFTNGAPRKSMTLAQFLPFVDRFGQYKHANWPGKVATEQELKDDVAREDNDLAVNPAPTDRDRFGGWLGGPKLEATGHFRTQKVDGKWWLVTPEGHLFWSNGVTCVGSQDYTPVTDREEYFEWLPKEGTFAQFMGKSTWGNPPGFYNRYPSYDVYHFRDANLYRKYGEGWRERFHSSTEQRFRSWGLNTIGAWSDPGLEKRGNLPYTTCLFFTGEPIQGSQGYWRPFPDPFSESFRASLRGALGGVTADPMRIGFFLNNELDWGNEPYLASATLRSPAQQPAKQAYLAVLQKKYGSVEALNAVWKTSHTSWDALLASQTAPDTGAAWEDLSAFSEAIADQYFQVCREEIGKAAPGALLLGCRFSTGPELGKNIIRSAARNSDVVSFNVYRKTPSMFEFDAPVLIGEFHFGALDRGLLHEGLVPVANQQERGKAYATYLRSALDNPMVVGAHWFQYSDEAISGRSDGENYQIGLVDICDRPYPETIGALREASRELYQQRTESHR